MKKPPLAAVLLISIVGTTFLHADNYIPLENFDSLPIGESPAGKDGWVVRSEGDASALIVEDPEGKSGHVLELKGASDPGQLLMLAKEGILIGKPPSPSIGTIYFRFRLTQGEVTESLKVGVSHVLPGEAVASGGLALKQYVWVRGTKPILLNADGSGVEPDVSFLAEIWYDAWLVISNGSEAVSKTRIFVRCADDPGFSEMREITGQFVETPVPVPLVTFCLIKQDPRTVLLDRIAYYPDAETPGEIPQ